MINQDTHKVCTTLVLCDMFVAMLSWDIIQYKGGGGRIKREIGEEGVGGGRKGVKEGEGDGREEIGRN